MARKMELGRTEKNILLMSGDTLWYSSCRHTFYRPEVGRGVGRFSKRRYSSFTSFITRQHGFPRCDE
jgi:hypothetical protein